MAKPACSSFTRPDNSRKPTYQQCKWARCWGRKNVKVFCRFEHYGQTITVDDVEYSMTLWDTAGQEDYERLRPLSYTNVSFKQPYRVSHIEKAVVIGSTFMQIKFLATHCEYRLR